MPPETPEQPTSHWSPALLALAACAGLCAGVLRRRRSTFRNRTVVITGGSRGLGLALARRFAAEGARLVLIARSPDQLMAARRELAHRGADVLAIRCDIRDRTAVDAAVSEVVRQFGTIDVLVNNAGVIQITPFAHARLEDFRDSLDTHFWGPLYLVKACLPIFQHQGGGRIVNIASIGGRVAVPHLTPYTVSKFALVGFSESLRAELRRYGVTVTTVTPHLMRTGSHRNVLVRGQHAKEATWFALATATPITAISADRAARRIVAAARSGRSSVTPGWMARAAELTHALAPGFASALTAAATRFVLPSPSESPSAQLGFDSHEVDLGRRARWFATEAAGRFNQRLAADERRG